MTVDIIYPDLSYQIMNVAFEVHRHLGPGFTEDFYERAFVMELRRRGIPYEQQKVMNVSYKGMSLGLYRLDLVIDNKVIVELKAVTQMNDVFLQQVKSYLKATEMQLGILINLGQVNLESKRVVNSLSKNHSQNSSFSRNSH